MRLITLLWLLSTVLSEEDTCDADTQGVVDEFSEQKWARQRIPQQHRFDGPLYPQLPRIRVQDLDNAENADYKSRTKPFILTGAMEGWGALDNWPIKRRKKPKKTGNKNYLSKLFQDAVADFYPYNMLEGGTHPYLIRYKAGIMEMMHPPGRFREGGQHATACSEGCRYLHLQLTPTAWSQLEDKGDIPSDRHDHLESDQWWMRRCLEDPEVREEYHIKTHWKIIVTGSRGSGMFNHTDSLRTASWHGQVQGRKWWYVCGHDLEMAHMGGASRGQHCYESVLHSGEVLFYGRGWYHHTRNLDTPSMTLTGTVVTKANFADVADKLHSECTHSALSFDFSGKLCDALDRCYPLWHRYLTGEEAPTGRWDPWRDIASASDAAKKDRVKPKDNNYDGRNYISQ